MINLIRKQRGYILLKEYWRKVCFHLYNPFVTKGYINVIFKVSFDEIINEYNMDSKTKIKEGRFLETVPTDAKVLFKFKGILARKDVTIAISLAKDKNYINPKIANQLVISELNIVKKLDFFNKKCYDIKSLQLNIEDYTFISQFIVKALFLTTVTLCWVHPG